MTFIVSVHIPKTGGTTLASIFDRTLQRRIIYDHEGYENADQPNGEIEKNKHFVSSYFKVLHGHFHAKKYVNVFPDADFIAMVRHPVERVISQYLHELNEPASSAWYHNDVASGKMTVVDFAGLPGMGTAMTDHLSGKSLEDFSTILVLEELVKSLAVLSKNVINLRLDHFYGVPPQIPVLKASAGQKQKRRITQKEKRAIYNRTGADNDLYARACAKLQTDFTNITW